MNIQSVAKFYLVIVPQDYIAVAHVQISRPSDRVQEKIKMWGILKGNCVGKKDDCAGNCVGLQSFATNKIFGPWLPVEEIIEFFIPFLLPDQCEFPLIIVDFL